MVGKLFISEWDFHHIREGGRVVNLITDLGATERFRRVNKACAPTFIKQTLPTPFGSGGVDGLGWENGLFVQ